MPRTRVKGTVSFLLNFLIESVFRCRQDIHMFPFSLIQILFLNVERYQKLTPSYLGYKSKQIRPFCPQYNSLLFLFLLLLPIGSHTNLLYISSRPPSTTSRHHSQHRRTTINRHHLHHHLHWFQLQPPPLLIP